MDDVTAPLLDAAPACGKAHTILPSLSSEARRLLLLTGPLLVEGVAMVALSTVTTLAVGRLNDPLALSGMVLASSLYNMTGYSIIQGLSSSLETLVGQAYGGGAFTQCGLFLQAGVLACLLAAAPIVLLWHWARPALVALGQAPELAALAALLLRWLAPSVALAAVTEPTYHYLVAQGVVLPAMVAEVAMLVLAPPLNWLLVYRLGWGAEGAAASLLVCSSCSCVTILGYAALRDARQAATADPSRTWGGWDPRGAVRRLGQFYSYGLPAVAMVCVEWWFWEFVVFAAGLLPDAQVAVGVVGVAVQVSMIAYMASYALGTATSSRVANALGAGEAARARRITRLAACMVLAVNLVTGGCLAAARRPLARVFTGDVAVQAQLMRVLPVVAVGVVADGQVAVLNAVLRAAGRQALGAGLHAAVMWGLGLPLAFLLAFHLRLGAVGLWLAPASCTLLQVAVFHTVVATWDWDALVAAAQKLAADGGATADPLGDDGVRDGGDVAAAADGDPERATTAAASEGGTSGEPAAAPRVPTSWPLAALRRSMDSTGSWGEGVERLGSGTIGSPIGFGFMPVPQWGQQRRT